MKRSNLERVEWVGRAVRTSIALVILLASATAAAQGEAGMAIAADEELVAADRAPQATRAAEAIAPGRGARPRLIVPPRPIPLTQPELQAALENARPDVRLCLEQNGIGRRASVTVRVRIDAQHRLTVRVRGAPRSAALEACADLAARRFTQPLQGRYVARAVSAQIREGQGGVGIPPPPPHPPPPPPPPGGRWDESAVHATLDAMRASFVECVSDLAPGTPGTMTLRVSVHVNGTMTLMGVDLPSGVRGPGSLPCLAGRVGVLHVPAPPSEVTVVHRLQLGG